MRLLCITGGTWYEPATGECNVPGPGYGDECTAIGECADQYGEYYLLAEWPPKGPDDGYDKNCFIPLMGAKEEIRSETRKLEHV